jgi:pimeloyl-ACP methyl ester carboxylesterase
VSERRYTELGSARIHSVHAGAGADVVLLHGLSGSRHWWRHSLDVLAESYRVHVPELVGFGRSRGGWRQPRIEQLAELMRAWMRAQGVTRAHLVGHSMGGQIALHIAADPAAELRTLTLVSASGIPRPMTVRAAARLVAGALPPRHWGAAGFLPTIALDALRSGPRRLALAGMHLLEDDVRPLLPRVRIPVLVVWGALDPLLPLANADVLVRGLPDARLVVFADAAHNPMADEPTAFNRVLSDFLARHDA